MIRTRSGSLISPHGMKTWPPVSRSWTWMPLLGVLQDLHVQVAAVDEDDVLGPGRGRCCERGARRGG